MARLYKVGGTLSSRGVEFVFVPIGHVVFDIGGDAVHFGLVADDAVIETRLPGEILVGLVGVMGDGRFHVANGNGQPVFLSGNHLHLFVNNIVFPSVLL